MSSVVYESLTTFLYRDVLKWTGCPPWEPEDVSQKEKEEAWNISAKEFRTPRSHLVWRQARVLCGPADPVAKPDREPAQAQTHGGPFQDHRGGAEAKEGMSHIQFFIHPLTLT